MVLTGFKDFIGGPLGIILHLFQFVQSSFFPPCVLTLLREGAGPWCSSRDTLSALLECLLDNVMELQDPMLQGHLRDHLVCSSLGKAQGSAKEGKLVLLGEHILSSTVIFS